MNQHIQEFIDQDTDTEQFRMVIEFFQNKRDGFFIEMGAADGVLASNTYRKDMEDYLSTFGYHKIGRIASDDFFLHHQ